jgi:hypothetical protein
MVSLVLPALDHVILEYWVCNLVRNYSRNVEEQVNSEIFWQLNVLFVFFSFFGRDDESGLYDAFEQVSMLFR